MTSGCPRGKAQCGPARSAVLIVAFALNGCVSSGHPAREKVNAPSFDAAAFFTGKTEGRGRLKIAFRSSDATLVEGIGRVGADHTIMLDQTVRRGDRAAIHRRWQLREDRQGHYIGTLSDADGPVIGTVSGNQLHLAFAMKGDLKANQWLYLAADGQSARNVMIVAKFGMPVARLDETIVRIGR